MKTDLIPRRTVLKGLGAVMALPWLEAMGLQTGWAAGNTPAKNAAPNRMAFLYVPNGVNMADWSPKSTGTDYELPAILQPLQELKSDFQIISGQRSPNCGRIVSSSTQACGESCELAYTNLAISSASMIRLVELS